MVSVDFNVSINIVTCDSPLYKSFCSFGVSDWRPAVWIRPCQKEMVLCGLREYEREVRASFAETPAVAAQATVHNLPDGDVRGKYRGSHNFQIYLSSREAVETTSKKSLKTSVEGRQHNG